MISLLNKFNDPYGNENIHVAGQDAEILVTGASGLVGSHLIKNLVKQGKKVKALYRTAIPQFENAEKAEWIQGDILDITFLENVIEGIKYVYHCAGLVSFNPNQKKQLYKINVEGTENIVNTCLKTKVEKLLYVSSVSALGMIKRKMPVNEKMQWNEDTNNSLYGRTKFLAETEVWRGIGEGLNGVIVNPAIILGQAGWHTGSAALFKNAYNEFPWFTEGITGFVDVEDVVKAMILLMESNITAERFIISAENITYHRLLNLIADSFGKKSPYRKATPFLAEIVWRAKALKSVITKKPPLITKETSRTAQTERYFDNNKLLQYLPGFSYQPLKQSIKRIVQEYKNFYSLV